MLLAAAGSGRLWLVAVGAVNVAISLYYYLMVVKRMYLDPPSRPAAVAVSPLNKAVLAFLLLGIMAIGIFQEPFLQRILDSVRP